MPPTVLSAVGLGAVPPPTTPSTQPTSGQDEAVVGSPLIAEGAGQTHLTAAPMPVPAITNSFSATTDGPPTAALPCVATLGRHRQSRWSS